MKNKHPLLFINIFLGMGMVLLVAYYLFMDENYSSRKPISDDKRLALEFRIPAYPDDAAVKKYYNFFLEDGIITKAEYVTLIELEQKYKEYISKNPTKLPMLDNQHKSALEKERENLAAFDRIGSAALPDNLVGPAREAITEKIAILEKDELHKKAE